MKLIKRLKSGRWPSGVSKPLGLFLCPICGAEVARPLYKGLQFKSCGCNQTPCGKDNPKYRHGMASSRLYRIWAGMLARCKAPAGSSNAKWYSSKGIRVCPEWQTAAAFLAWAKAAGYAPGLMIDRVDNDLGYCPENCRWVTPKQSAMNTIKSKWTALKLAQVREALAAGMSQTEAAETFHISRTTIRKHILNQ